MYYAAARGYCIVLGGNKYLQDLTKDEVISSRISTRIPMWRIRVSVTIELLLWHQVANRMKFLHICRFRIPTRSPTSSVRVSRLGCSFPLLSSNDYRALIDICIPRAIVPWLVKQDETSCSAILHIISFSGEKRPHEALRTFFSSSLIDSLAVSQVHVACFYGSYDSCPQADARQSRTLTDIVCLVLRPIVTVGKRIFIIYASACNLMKGGYAHLNTKWYCLPSLVTDRHS
jgi:hypothetical protein